MKKEKEKKKKKVKLKFRFKLILLITFVVIYAFTFGTKGIFTKDYVIKTKKLSNKYDSFKIVHFSDIHYNGNSSKSMIKKAVKKINKTNPDIVIFSGDLLYSSYSINDEDTEFIKKEFAKIQSNYGNYYVLGDEDDENTSTILNVSGFINLSNNEQKIYKDNKKPILLINDNCINYFENNKDSSYNILVTHDPDDFNDFKKYNFDMVLSGHTLNGQINIYGLKNALIDSKYKKTYQRIKNTKMYVNPGIGTGNLKVRLFNHPTINVYRFMINY